MRRAWRGSVPRVTYPRSCSTAMVFAAACLETDRGRPSSEALPAPAAMARAAQRWGARTPSQAGPHTLTAAAGQPAGRAVPQRAEAAEQQQGEVGAGAGHGSGSPVLLVHG